MSIKKIISLSTFLLFLLSFSTESLQSQNYALFNKNRNLTYTKLNADDGDSVFYFSKIDSVISLGTDSIYYFNLHLDTVDVGSCEAINGEVGMFGSRMIKKNDIYNTHVFFNNNGDSIFMRQNIEEDDFWTMYTWPDGTYIKALVVNNTSFSPLPDTPDSIFSIQLNVFTPGGMILTDSFPNQTRIYFARDHNFIQFFDFSTFPIAGDRKPYIIRGFTNPDEYKADVYAENAFDYELGYEFHFREEIAPDPENGASKRISAWKYFVMDKVNTPEYVNYTMERIRIDTLYIGDAPSLNITWDTIEVTYNYSDYGFLDTLELNVFQSERFGYSDWVQNDTVYRGISHKYVYDWFEYDDATGCLNNPDNIAYPEQLYGDGLGLMHYKDSTDADNYYMYDMVFFHLGLLEWGEPYDFSLFDLAIHAQNEMTNVSLYPNPASDFISIKILEQDLPLYYSVYSSLGVLELQGELLNGLSTIPVYNLANGLHVIELHGENKHAVKQFVKMTN